MNVSRLTFTKETKDKMSKPLTHFERGKLRWDKIKELENEGKLAMAKNRQEILNLMGAPAGYSVVYGWLSTQIRKGYIKEVLTGFDKHNQPEYEYYTSGGPSHDPTWKRAAESKKANRKSMEVRKATREAVKKLQTVMSSPSAPTSETTTVSPANATETVMVSKLDVPSGSNISMVIKYKELSIELHGVDTMVVAALLDTIISKTNSTIEKTA